MPDGIQVGPHRYSVSCDRNALNAAGIAMSSDLLGHSDHKTLAITLADDLAPSAKRDTLLHEVLHAAFDQTSIAHDIGDKEEERLILRLSPVLLDVLRRNPELVAYLVDE